jgi:ribosomal protein L37AE/L43A
MTGKITFVPTQKTLHDREGCQGKPHPDSQVRGTIWTCDDCGKEWVKVEGAQYNEAYSAWRVLTEKNRDGIER